MSGLRRASGNRFLDALPSDVSTAITRVAALRVVGEDVPLGRAGEPVREVHFPVNGVIAHTVKHGDGRSASVLEIGPWGVSGFEALTAAEPAAFGRLTVVPLSTFAVDPHKLAPIVEASPAFRALLARYTLAVMRIASLGAACQRHDRVEARLARWLLALYDYAAGSAIGVTHERTARMLGMRRAGVTSAYAAMVTGRAIAVERGRVRVLDPAALDSMACVCRSETQAIVDRLYGDPPPG